MVTGAKALTGDLRWPPANRSVANGAWTSMVVASGGAGQDLAGTTDLGQERDRLRIHPPHRPWEIRSM